LRIEWDHAKSDANEAKHGVRFEDAAELLSSEAGFLEIYDEDHSDDEDRFIAIGPVGGRLIVVAYAERDDDVLRVISARMATKVERGMYEDFENARFRG
jgi:uncharacterized DUF497 family protein